MRTVYYEIVWNAIHQTHEVQCHAEDGDYWIIKFGFMPDQADINAWSSDADRMIPMEEKATTATAHFYKPQNVIRSVDGVPYEQHG